jgi:hypothetical protein
MHDNGNKQIAAQPLSERSSQHNDRQAIHGPRAMGIRRKT